MHLTASHVNAIDGELGKIKDVYFDDQHWAVRFLVVDTHRWMPLSQKVLLSPIALLKFSREDTELKVSMSQELVRNCPKVEEEETVSREFEKMYFDYFGYGYYWTGPGAWGEYAYPTALFERDPLPLASENKNHKKKENHLRSADELKDYDVAATDGNKGHVYDFIYDTTDWCLKFIVIDTKNWLIGGKKVLLATQDIKLIDWVSKTVSCKLSMEQIVNCPEYDSKNLDDLSLPSRK